MVLPDQQNERAPRVMLENFRTADPMFFVILGMFIATVFGWVARHLDEIVERSRTNRQFYREMKESQR